mgnify:CR=1 FL=1
MKKSTIWIIASVMGISLLTLLYLQFRYFENVYDMRKEQFEEAVNRSLNQTAQDLELYEAQARLDSELTEKQNTNTVDEDSLQRAYRQQMAQAGLYVEDNIDSMDGLNGLGNYAVEDTVNQFFRQKELMEEMLSILYKPNNKELSQRLDFKELDSTLKRELNKNGVNLAYHFRVTTSDGREVFKCQDYVAESEDEAYRQELFPNAPRAQMGVLYVHFPDMRKYIFYSVRFMIPAIIFTLIVLVVFCVTIYTIFRQKRLSEIKNDFINNMTHEFKTPISTISLAAQMLGDPSVMKSDAMFKHISGIINDETKRLRFQVEKVLQMSMFDKKAATFKKREVDVNDLIEDVVNTFRLKVESSGGTIETHLDSSDALVFVDEMHFTNVLFNLMDNAVKYKKENVDLHLVVSTKFKEDKVHIEIVDNGIGIKKEDVKKIFEKFYRVHTGNRHDVKGFGLGLAYVKNVISNFGGNIQAESEYGLGTKFIITLPTLKISAK